MTFTNLISQQNTQAATLWQRQQRSYMLYHNKPSINVIVLVVYVYSTVLPASLSQNRLISPKKSLKLQSIHSARSISVMLQSKIVRFALFPSAKKALCYRQPFGTSIMSFSVIYELQSAPELVLIEAGMQFAWAFSDHNECLYFKTMSLHSI